MTAHLYAYLANWRMLRNSFLAKRDYLFSRPVIDILCNPEYTELLSIDPFSDNNDVQIDLILSVKDEINKYYVKEKIFEIIDECHEVGVSSVSISGGEPFAHPNIYEILSRLDTLHMHAVIITNLSLLSIENAINIAKRGHALQVTLDYPNKDLNDSTRGKGSFELVLNLLKVFNE